MPNYEELYYIARNKYYQAIEERNTAQRRISELQAQKSRLSRELSEKQVNLSAIQEKKAMIQEVHDTCGGILNNEFPTMNKDLLSTSEEYKKIISSDSGVADLASIYASDISGTKNGLEAAKSEIGSALKALEEQVDTAQKEITSCNSELESVSAQLRTAGDPAAIQWKINSYYTEMKEYERRWMNGE